MKEGEIRKIVATYFGFTPSIKEEKIKMRILRGSEVDGGEDTKVKVRWEEHIGNLSGVARISPMDIMHELKLDSGEKNYRRAVEIMKGIAKRDDLYFVEIEGDRYLLINPRYRR